jgi:hypothetical protein
METVGFIGVGGRVDRAVKLYQRCADMGLSEDNDVAVMIDVLNAMPRQKHGKRNPA